MPFHAQSLFGTGPRRPLTRDQRRIWSARVELHRRARAITATHALVAGAMLRLLGADGRLDPCHDTLARLAGCCARTVGEALRRLRRVGMVDWLRRIVRVGGRVRQTSNAYRLLEVTAHNPMQSAALGAKSAAMVTASRCAGRTRDGASKGISERGAALTVAQQLAAVAAWVGEASSRRRVGVDFPATQNRHPLRGGGSASDAPCTGPTPGLPFGLNLLRPSDPNRTGFPLRHFCRATGTAARSDYLSDTSDTTQNRPAP